MIRQDKGLELVAQCSSAVTREYMPVTLYLRKRHKVAGRADWPVHKGWGRVSGFEDYFVKGCHQACLRRIADGLNQSNGKNTILKPSSCRF